MIVQFKRFFSGTILVGASFQTLSAYLVSPDLQERFKQVGHGKLLRSILLNSFRNYDHWYFVSDWSFVKSSGV